MKGRTTFVIAQRLQTVKDAQQIFVLDKQNRRTRHASPITERRQNIPANLEPITRSEELGSEWNIMFGGGGMSGPVFMRRLCPAAARWPGGG